MYMLVELEEMIHIQITYLAVDITEAVIELHIVEAAEQPT